MQQNSVIGISSLPNLLHNEFLRRGCNFNIMIVGSHGLGKTTFLNKLLESKVIKTRPFDGSSDNPFPIMEAKCNIQTSSLEICENGFSVRLGIVEVDGIGDCVDNRECYKPIVELLEAKFEDYLNKSKTQTKTTIDDQRIHICFYFLEPIFTIKSPDLETLIQISAHCTVVPVMAKADLISRDQILDLKTSIRSILVGNKISFFEDLGDHSEGPFMIFSESRDEDPLKNADWNPSAFNTQTNDFITLKRLVIEKNAISLIKLTDQYYDNYRIARLMVNCNDKEVIEAKERIEKKIASYQEQIQQIQGNLGKKFKDGIEIE